jgi:mono/diheme cytochrome c family protein
MADLIIRLVNMATIRSVLQPKYLLISVGLMLIGLAVSCGSAPASNTSDTNTTSNNSSAPTQTLFPTYEFVAPTEAPQMATLAASTAAAGTSNQNALDPERVSRGKDRYEALECNSCHGANGEGTDQGDSLAALSLSEEDFVSFMRSGGAVGISHQYNTNRLSDSGSRNLYQYILSLTEE